jgi:outer membrane protein assembly factor BamB
MDKATGSSVWKQDKLSTRRPGGPQMIGRHVGVIDVEGYLHVLDGESGNLVGRIATDGSPATGQPLASGGTMVWQSTNGTLYGAIVP